jgi:hypothetical protein
MGVDTKSMAEAWSLWDRIWADDRVVFVPEPELRCKFPLPLSCRGADLLMFLIVGLLYLLRFERVDNLGDTKPAWRALRRLAG